MEVGVKESFKGRKCGKNEGGKIGREQMPREWRGKGGDEDLECDWRTAVKEIWEV